MLAAICLGLVTLFEKKLRRLFRKITPHYQYVVLVSCIFYWIYSSIQFDPSQTPLLAILILNLRFLVTGLILCWLRMQYSFRDLILFSALLNIGYYADIMVIIVNLFNIARYRRYIFSNGIMDCKTIFK